MLAAISYETPILKLKRYQMGNWKSK